MPVTVTSAIIDDGGEQIILTLAGVATPLAGTPVFLLHRTPGVNLNATAFKIDSDTQITINGVRLTSAGASSYIRNGEVVTIDYVSGLTGNSIAIPAINGTICTNNSQRLPRIEVGSKFKCDENCPTIGNFIDGNSVRIYKQTDIDAGAPRLVATSGLVGGKWRSPVLLDVGTAYVLNFYNQEGVQISSRTLTV